MNIDLTSKLATRCSHHLPSEDDEEFGHVTNSEPNTFDLGLALKRLTGKIEEEKRSYQELLNRQNQ